MPHHPGFIILYVDSPPTSAAFYADLFGIAPAESSPSFAMFALESGAMLGLWEKNGVQPAPERGGDRSELAIAVSDETEVGALHVEWRNRGLRILQAPVKMDFGLTFVALDPDGHRLRVFAPGAP